MPTKPHKRVSDRRTLKQVIKETEKNSTKHFLDHSTTLAQVEGILENRSALDKFKTVPEKVQHCIDQIIELNRSREGWKSDAEHEMRNSVIHKETINILETRIASLEEDFRIEHSQCEKLLEEQNALQERASKLSGELNKVLHDSGVLKPLPGPPSPSTFTKEFRG